MCGCLGSNTKSKARPRQVSVTNEVLRSEPVCLHLLEDIKEIERKVLVLLKVNVTDTILFEANKELRVWIRALNVECPNEDSYNVIKQYVENEYTKYNS